MKKDGTVVRRSIRSLSDAQKHDLLLAFDRIQKLPSNNPNSYWAIAGFHGVPFLPSEGEWGGWCNHGNVLFPMWHR